MYKVKMLCFDTPDDAYPYEDSPAVDKSFKSYDNAYDYAKKLCLDEYLGLCEPTEEETSEERTRLYAIMENYENKTIGVYFRMTSNSLLQMTQYYVISV